MTAPVMAPYRSDIPAGRDSFPQLLRAELTKFRTVRGWVITIFVAAVVTAAIGMLSGLNTNVSCNGPCHYVIPTGPGGEAVTDSYYFYHQPLTGHGSITVRVTGMAGRIQEGLDQTGQPNTIPGLQPWSKAGLMVTSSTKQGSPYAAVMVTGSQGVRMQYNYVHDIAGSPGTVSAASPRWLRLTRDGDELTGFESADGSHWTKIGTADVAGLGSTAQVGLFATSPEYTPPGNHQLFSGSSTTMATEATGAFDNVGLGGGWSGSAWHGQAISSGADSAYSIVTNAGAASQTGGGSLAITGTGDIAPADAAIDSLGGASIDSTLQGAFAGMIAVVVLGALFITVEYRRGLIRLSMAATPRRGRILAAKAIVIGAVTFVAGLIGVACAVLVGEKLLRGDGLALVPMTALTEVRVIVGTAAVLAIAAVLALGVGTILRNSAGAITVVIAAIVLPYVLATTISVLPATAAEWLLRFTPAAGFAIQQAVPQYAQVSGTYTPNLGYFPLAPWAGFAVLCGWALLALAVAAVVLRKRDA
jgi:ABC-type transport system involved in multi-copper enzyme maturation permease subunit